MKVLIVGSGGREHAIATSVAKSSKVDKIYCAPGNAGIAEYAECVPISAMEFDKLAAFAKEHEDDLTVIGMDDPLVGGIVDAFEAEGLRVFGPRKNAAIIEGSKAFSKDLMKKYDYLVVGAGLYGAVFANQAKAAGRKVLVVEKRPHIAGNIYTEEDLMVEGDPENVVDFTVSI